MLKSTNNGFHITFANGFTVSVQWSSSSYAHGYGGSTYALFGGEAANAEVAFWKDGGPLIHKDEWGDCVKGWMSPDEVVAFLAEVAAM
tara:strand:+ start:2335 stop:2598 length:264 start_codon:yes stop_codon:yes gene_type:complete